MLQLNQRIALITGASSGIGWGIAREFHQNQMKQYLVDKNQPPQQLEQSEFFQLDLLKPGKIDQLTQQIDPDQMPDILICNAGQGISEKISEGDPDKWEKIIQLNLMANLRLVRAFIYFMKAKGRGDIVFVSSVSANRPHPYNGIYTATKVGMEAIAETIRLEEQPNIRVLTIAPGVVDTGFFDATVGPGQSVEQIGWGALDSSDIAQAVLFAISRPPHVSINYISIRPSAQPL
ncbi:MAG: SDR family oxidoreductase [Candidatus Cyclobacteriaceae bacterium M3_2C_046]